MRFADGIEIALVGAAFACTNAGQDLFNGLQVRCSHWGISCFTSPGYGIVMNGYVDANAGPSRVAASGVPLKLP